MAITGGIYFFSSIDKTSKDKFVEKYNSVTGIKAQYQIDGASLKKTVNDNPENTVRVILGDKNAQEFIPSLTISRWDEVSFKVKPEMGTMASNDRTMNFNGNKVEVSTPKVDYSLYEIPKDEENPEGAFEYDLTLKEKPVTNKIGLNIETQGLDFFFQPPLNKEVKIGENGIVNCTETDCYDKDGGVIIHRPENVVGSYAVYTSDQKINFAGGKIYATGKVGHIFRPKIIDSAEKETWGTLNIDKDAGILSVEIPQEFLDKATYPIRRAVGLSFGYTTTPGTAWAAVSCISMIAASYIYTAATGDTITKFSISGYSSGGTTGFDAAAYTVVSGVPSARLAAGVTIVLPTVKAWTDSSAVSQVMSNNVTYSVAIGNDGAVTEYIYYDTGTGTNRSEDGTTGALPATWTQISTSGSKWGMYATYTKATSNFFLLF